MCPICSQLLHLILAGFMGSGHSLDTWPGPSQLEVVNISRPSGLGCSSLLSAQDLSLVRTIALAMTFLAAVETAVARLVGAVGFGVANCKCVSKMQCNCLQLFLTLMAEVTLAGVGTRLRTVARDVVELMTAARNISSAQAAGIARHSLMTSIVRSGGSGSPGRRVVDCAILLGYLQSMLLATLMSSFVGASDGLVAVLAVIIHAHDLLHARIRMGGEWIACHFDVCWGGLCWY